MSHAPVHTDPATLDQIVDDHTPSHLTRRHFIVAGATAVGAWSLAGSSLSAGSPPGGSSSVRRTPEVLTGWTRAVYGQVKAERMLPPAAARAYAHVALAGYEAIVGSMPRHRSLSGRVDGYMAPPNPAGIDYEIAANEAMAVPAAAVFADRSQASRDALEAYRAELAARLESRGSRRRRASSVRYGLLVGAAVADRAAHDRYAETRSLPYAPPTGPGLWAATPPNFGSAIEPHWGQIRSFTLATNDECRPVRPAEYSEEPGSPFWGQAMATYRAVNELTEAQRATALYWRDNPDGTTGLPSGHWMLIACAAIEQRGLNIGRAAEVLALTGIALADGFTSCWTEKYQSNLVRPVTYIQHVIDPAWSSPVNSPAFPEYTSGHSVGSGAAAEVLTRLLGPIPFDDPTGLETGYVPRRFESFRAAAEEAAVSRLYGGIHYPMAIDNGLDQGVDVARKVLARATTRRRGRG